MANELQYVLFSDCNNRQDIKKFIQGDIESANKIKLELEEKQRQARKLRGCE